MKIYTRTGDEGLTGLYGGTRVSKADPRIECIGAVDELNANIGLCAVAAGPDLLGQLRKIQEELFIMGSQLGSPEDTSGLPRLHSETVDRLETEIDSAESTLTPLKNFILPGGGELAARLHLARTVCRRAERSLVTLGNPKPSPLALTYLNRLSDWLFVQARKANQLANIADVPWKRG